MAFGHVLIAIVRLTVALPRLPRHARFMADDDDAPDTLEPVGAVVARLLRAYFSPNARRAFMRRTAKGSAQSPADQTSVSSSSSRPDKDSIVR